MKSFFHIDFLLTDGFSLQGVDIEFFIEFIVRRDFLSEFHGAIHFLKMAGFFERNVFGVDAFFFQIASDFIQQIRDDAWFFVHDVSGDVGVELDAHVPQNFVQSSEVVHGCASVVFVAEIVEICELVEFVKKLS